MTKVPTADLEEDKPALPDEVALGVTYDDIDDYLEGKEVPEASRKQLKIIIYVRRINVICRLRFLMIFGNEQDPTIISEAGFFHCELDW